jgi:murein DD-endopeptidase MepM/ murein hydrolase activator NlpD
MNLKALSKGTRSLLALVALAGIVGLGGLAGRTLSVDSKVPSVTSGPSLPVLAAQVFDPEDYGLPAVLSRYDTTLRRRETLSGLLDRLEVNRLEAHQALSGLIQAGYLDPRRTLPGLAVSAHLANGQLDTLSLNLGPERRLMSKRMPDGTYHPIELKARLSRVPRVVSGTIDSSLYETARAQDVGDQQIFDFAQVFAYDVDFQREVHPGDRFEMVYDVFVDERGQPIRRGAVHYAALHGRVTDKSFYRFTTPDDDVTDYFEANGDSATRFLMKTPINGARLSSSFGRRRHPISGYTRLHKGTDFAAPTGTPIFAAGHGVVERASRYGGYGHYVRIRHANGYKTAYAHMSRYGRGIRAGRQVRQGDIIGYVGSTGASTGPHLHYEVYVHGEPVNAMRLKLPTGRKLSMAPEMLEMFLQVRDEMDAVRAAARPPAGPALVSEVIPPAP